MTLAEAIKGITEGIAKELIEKYGGLSFARRSE